VPDPPCRAGSGIIASLLSLGKSVEFVQDKYRELTKKIFKGSLFRWGLLRARFNQKALEESLKSEDTLGSLTTLGSPKLQTGLMVMAKRMDTGSPWPLTNNPRGKYYGPKKGSTAIPNADYPLWRIVRASTAAPYYFKPERILVATEEIDGMLRSVEGDFVDGGVSTANNPALQALQVVTLEGFRLQWQTGADDLLLVSVGTGRRNLNRKVPWFAAGNALKALMSIMDDCNELVETMLQWMAATDTARKIDSEIGALINDQIAQQLLLTYQRYNVEFNSKWLRDIIKKDYTDERLKTLEKMDDPRNIDSLETIGELAAEQLIKDKHFPLSFDLR
jgi:predicted acylesterase/phospholipase RssA